jgi:hypothetical protein
MFVPGQGRIGAALLSLAVAAAGTAPATPAPAVTPAAPPGAARPPAAAPAPTPGGTPTAAAALVDEYLDHYFALYPSEATAAGRHDFDGQLENLSTPRRTAWLTYNVAVLGRVDALLADAALGADERLDLELLRRRAGREAMEIAVRRRPERDPLYWTDRLANAQLFLMLREEVPLADRQAAAAARATAVPRLAAEARAALGHTDPRWISRELALGAAVPAAAALDGLAVFLDQLAAHANGSPRLGALYSSTFQLGTGSDEPVAAVLARAEADLVTVRAAAARYGRSVWKQVLPAAAPPADDRALLRRLFARVAADHAATTAEMVADYRRQVADLEGFIRQRGLATLPDPLTLTVGPSPGYLIGQSVGGVYAAGPYAPDARTLWLLPTPADAAPPTARAAFFRDFNHHFNVMITAHEIFPGHYMQLKIAAHQPHKVRALFADDLYVEGWGTFCERLMLDQGWGGPLDRLAHLKKQIENVARTIVDIRVHTHAMTRQQVLAFGRDQALQDAQFAANLWTRAITSSPQLTTYYLGDSQVQALYDDLRRRRGAAFSVREFVDGMMAIGPVPVARYRERLLPR